MKFHIIHDWGKWSPAIDTHMDYTKLQFRSCESCNRIQVKKIRQPWNIWFGAIALSGEKK